MRDILFKAKRIDNGEWVEGYYAIVDVVHYIYSGFLCDGGLYVVAERFEVDVNTLCQYTGLNDKLGNKIWDNDLIECKEFSNGYLIKHFLSQVEWDDDGTGFAFKDSKHGWAFMDSLTVYECQVIGNIYDNPELLEGGGEDE